MPQTKTPAALTFTTRTGKIITAPAGAYAAIVAEVEVNESDLSTDYFATSTARRVLIGWRFTARESFTALRKAAACYGPTRHLGPNCHAFSVEVVLEQDVISNGTALWAGRTSPWHTDERQRFATQAEVDAYLATAPALLPFNIDGQAVTFRRAVVKVTIEHRENYSMGAGNYLKRGSRYSHGIKVRSISWGAEIDAVALHVATAAA